MLQVYIAIPFFEGKKIYSVYDQVYETVIVRKGTLYLG